MPIGVMACGNGIYEPAPYHGKNSSGVKNAAPIDGQSALNNSLPIDANGTRRIAIEGDHFVILDGTDGVYHGHQRTWDELLQHQKNVLISAGLTTPKGKIK